MSYFTQTRRAALREIDDMHDYVEKYWRGSNGALTDAGVDACYALAAARREVNITDSSAEIHAICDSLEDIGLIVRPAWPVFEAEIVTLYRPMEGLRNMLEAENG